MKPSQKGVILVGHGGVPKDCPPGWVRQLKQLESQRRATGSPMTAEENELDQKIRQWPRTPENDPYKTGLEALADRLQPLLGESRLILAYNEFCAPSVEDAIEALILEGYNPITLVPSMLTPGGSHSQIEIPEAIDSARQRFPNAKLNYAWPFDLDKLAEMFAKHIDQKG